MHGLCYTGADYSIIPDSVTFNPNQTERNIYVTAFTDSLLEFNETFELHIEVSHDAEKFGIVPSTPSTLSITILNNDSE